MRANDDRAVSEVVGIVLMFGLVVASLSIFQAQVVPTENKQVEIDHYEQAGGEMSQLKSEYLTAAGTKKIRSTTVTPGTKYSRRTLFVSGPSPRGRVQTTTVDNGTITANGLDVSQACGGVNKTRNIVFDTDYNQFSDSQTPPYVFEHTVVHRQADGTTLSRADQQLLQGSTLNLYPLTSNFSRSGVESTSIGFGSVNPITTPVSGDLNVTIPTTISAKEWERLLSDEPKFDSAVQSDPNRVTLNISDADQVRCAPVSTGFPDTIASASNGASGGQINWIKSSIRGQNGITRLSDGKYRLDATTSTNVNLRANSTKNTSINYSTTNVDIVSFSRTNGTTNKTGKNSTTIRPLDDGNATVFASKVPSSDSITVQTENTVFPYGIVFTSSPAASLSTLKDGSTSTTHTNKELTAIGPITSGVDGNPDTDIEIPYVDDRNKLRIIAKNGAGSKLADNATGSLVAVGKFDSSDTSVFYVNSSTADRGDIYRATDTGTEEVKNANAKAILGIADINSDSNSELIYAKSEQVYYFEGVKDTSPKKIDNGGFATVNSDTKGIGAPADFDSDGKETIPVFGGNGIKLLNSTGVEKKINFPNGDNKNTYVATTDIDKDEVPEIVYLDSSSNLRYIDRVRSNTPSKKFVRNPDGTAVNTNPDRGVA